MEDLRRRRSGSRARSSTRPSRRASACSTRRRCTAAPSSRSRRRSARGATSDRRDEDLDAGRSTKGERSYADQLRVVRPRRDRAGAQPRRVGGAPALARGGARCGTDRPHRRHALRRRRAFDELARALRTGRFDALQLPYNPRERECERELLPLAAELGVAVIVMRPLGGTGRGSPAHPPPATSSSRSREFGVETWPQALLKWALSDERDRRRDPGDDAPGARRENAPQALRRGSGRSAARRSHVERLAGGTFLTRNRVRASAT